MARIGCVVYLAAIRSKAIAIAEPSVAANVAGARGATGRTVRGVAGRGTAATVIRVVGDIRFAAIGQVTVAVAVASGADNPASPAVAGRCAVASRANRRTGSAMVDVGLEVHLTTVCYVAVAVVIASVASDSANAIGTRGAPVHC
jgi:hypothetical protein